jgi:two-component system response regulator LytT
VHQKDLVSLICLKALEEKLPSSKFMRVHRSYIVSLDKINALAKNSILINKLKITIGELYKETFKIVVDKWIK